MLLDLLKLYIASDELSNRDILQAERDVERICDSLLLVTATLSCGRREAQWKTILNV